MVTTGFPERSEIRRHFKSHLAAARAGSYEALGRLLQHGRGYLLSVAKHELDPHIKGKVGGSDLVQDTFLRAQSALAQFRGETWEEWLAWLRSILRNELTDTSRHYQGTEKRCVKLEVPLGQAPPNLLAAKEESPSAVAVATERHKRLREAVAALPERQRQLIQWRNYELLPFDTIGKRLGKSAEAARKEWARAVEQLVHRLDLAP